ncbi:hypothetical protein [Microlunatus speluncae]|uniref:hypothetical protein n=1 Tax=Microlunatus speluncae TaxID=2594267 RepID=UPI0012668295|nr:hypothetical protein [Microlunatus speluncae]
MSLTRRSLLGTAILGTGLLAAGCVPGFLQPQGILPSTDWVVDRLDKLIAATGRDHFRRLWIQQGALAVDLLTSDGVVRGYQYFSEKTGWEEPHSPEELDPEVDPPTSVPLADLHLDRLPQWEKLLRPPEDGLTFRVDEVGRLQLWASGAEQSGGLLLDGSARVAELSDDVPADVVRAIEEIVASYGNQAESVGGFNDFVHVDLNVAGSEKGMRVIRYPTTAPQASVTDALFPSKSIFDPTTVDPTLALDLLDSIPAKAKLDGQAWDWRIMRPPGGGEPTLSYGIGVDAPKQRVWVDAAGKIIAVQGNDCGPAKDWCPR